MGCFDVRDPASLKLLDSLQPPPTIVQLLEERAARDAQRAFLQDVHGGLVSYGAALDVAHNWAGSLQALDIGEGTIVSTMIPNSVAGMLLWFGLALVRAWEAPVHTSHHGAMLERAVTTVAAKTLFVHSTMLDRIAESADRLTTLRRIVVLGTEQVRIPALPFEVVTADELLEAGTPPRGLVPPQVWDVAAIIPTSGTTGPSKGVLVPWGRIIANLRVWPLEDLNEDDVLYHYSPSSHIAGKMFAFLTALLNAKLVMRPSFKTDEFLPDIRTYGITTAYVPTAIVRFLESVPPDPADFELPLRNVNQSPMSEGMDAFRKRFGVRVSSSFGSTELPSVFASDGWDSENWRSVGRVATGWPWFEVRVVDEHDFDVGPGNVGELIVRAAAPWTLNLGYFGMPDATARAWRNGWFHTGDAFRYDDNGYFYFVDRLTDTIRRRGENISSFEVEYIAIEHPDVREAAAIAVPSDYGEDEIKLCVVAPAGSMIDPDELLRFLDERLPRYMVPRYIEVLDELPLTMGNSVRVQKFKLREQGITPQTWDRDAANAAVRIRAT